MNPFRNKARFYGEKLVAPRQPPSRSLNPCRLPSTAYSKYPQLMRTFGPKGEDVKDEWKKRYNEELNDLYCSPSIVWVMGGACSTYGAKRGSYRILGCKPKERNHLHDPVVEGKTILRRIIRKWDVGVWTGLIWLRIGKGCGHL